MHLIPPQLEVTICDLKTLCVNRSRVTQALKKQEKGG